MSNHQCPTPLLTTIETAWSVVAPFWPIQNLVAVNPLMGLEHLPFDIALQQSERLWGHPTLPEPIREVNRISIKWCQVLMDQGQARIGVGAKHIHLYDQWKPLAIWDSELTRHCSTLNQWLTLPSIDLIAHHCRELGLTDSTQLDLFTCLLTSLPGWAAHVHYLEKWAPGRHDNCQIDFIAIRLTILRALCAHDTIMNWITSSRTHTVDTTPTLERITTAETNYLSELIPSLKTGLTRTKQPIIPDVQLAFCIDVRSEPMRRIIESMGPYTTFGIAGFFGIPVQVADHVSFETFNACPVLVTPEYRVHDRLIVTSTTSFILKSWNQFQRGIRYLYRTMKYTFTAPFALVEVVGGFLGLAMAVRTLLPTIVRLVPMVTGRSHHGIPSRLDSLESIGVEDQVRYAENALRSIGLTHHFAPLVVFCGHGSASQNNAYASALDCGACGGHHGDFNARIIAQILNSTPVRDALRTRGITIPSATIFVGALHNTTTDAIDLRWESDTPRSPELNHIVSRLNDALIQARHQNSILRTRALGYTTRSGQSLAMKLGMDWAQIRPEWGLARNAAIIVAERSLTHGIDLDGRAFLHSYDWESDTDGSILVRILDAPVVVAHWINSQYLFSTIYPIRFGSGSKVTQNITGKHSVMQGNGSDLMTGLPLQSLYINSDTAFHDPLRLTIVIMAPIDRVISAVKQSPKPLQLILNEWAHLVVVDPDTHRVEQVLAERLTNK